MLQSLLTFSLLFTGCVFVAPFYSKPIFTSKYQHGLPIASGDYQTMLASVAYPTPVVHPILTPLSPTVAVAPLPVVAAVAPAAPSSATVPITISQTPTKPIVAFSQPAIQHPEYTMPQPVLNHPVITEVQKIIRRPIITEVQEVVHKPYLTGYQQTIKLPKYMTPLLQEPDYSLVHREPAMFNSEQYHFVNTPRGQMLHLPPQFVQSGAANVLVPSVHQHTGTPTIVQSAVVVPVAYAQPVPVALATGSVIPPVVLSNSCPPAALYGSAGSFGGYGQKYGYHCMPSPGYL